MNMLPESIPDSRIALQFENELCSFGKLRSRIDAWVSFLNSIPKLKPHDLILAQLPNGIEFVALFYAVLQAKGIFMPVDTSSSTEEITRLIQRFKIRFIITDRNQFFSLSPTPPLSFPPPLSFLRRQESRLLDFTKEPVFFLKVSPLNSRSSKKIVPPSSKVIAQFTSGTTGIGKPVLRDYSDLLEECVSVSKRLQLTGRDKVFCPLRLTHSYALTTCLTSTLYAGATFVGIKQFLPSSLLTPLKKQIQIIAGTPFVYETLLRLPGFRSLSLESVRLCLSAGATLKESVFDDFLSKTGLPISQLYGMTETGVVSIQHPFTLKMRHTVGAPLDHIRVEIGNRGRIFVKKKRTVIRTNDSGSLTQEGYLTLNGRLDTKWNIQGKKVDPKQIEEVLRQYPRVLEAKVFKTSVIGKELLNAEIVSEKTFSPQSLYRHCLKKLPLFMAPKLFKRVTRLSQKALI